MAKLFPVLSSVARKMRSGERRFASRLETHLEDDYLCWYDVPVGRAGTHPDFIILHPRRGILILEVKDWRLSSIKSFDKKSVTLITDKGLKHTANPLEQARQYAHAVTNLLERDPALRRPEGSPYQGRLILPWGHGVVLTNITRAQLEAAGQGEDIGQVLPLERVICQDEMLESTDPAAFQAKLWGMFRAPFPCLLTLPQVDRVRWHLFPEIRVTQTSLELGNDQDTTADVPDLVRVMDLQQEQLARSLGEGHRVIHGVAGSGKTMILGYRAKHLAQALAKPILVLCYNAALAARLQHMMDERGLREKVSARSFHGWCHDQMRLYHVPRPDGEGQEYFERLVEAIIRGVDRGQIPRAQYGAVLIDEGHDFEAEWLKLVAQMVDLETNSLLVLYDDAQSINRSKSRLGFSFAEVGIQARGRTTVLKLNYRNTAEVIAVARGFAREVLSGKEADEDGIPLLVPESAGRRGEIPTFKRLANEQGELAFIVRQARELHDGGAAWKDMAVLFRVNRDGERIAEHLSNAGIPVNLFGKGPERRSFRPGEDSVKLMTFHSSKGLEFPIVFIPFLETLPYMKDDVSGEAKLLYVAMTRAMDRLYLTHHGDSRFVS